MTYAEAKKLWAVGWNTYLDQIAEGWFVVDQNGTAIKQLCMPNESPAHARQLAEIFQAGRLMGWKEGARRERRRIQTQLRELLGI